MALAITLLSGCGRGSRKSSAHLPAPPQPARTGSTETGVASWYGHPYHGRPTASGEIYDMEKFTAAHRSLPFETWLEVTNLSNGKHVEVRVTDRGPFVDGRIIDLSHAAAQEIDMVRTGTARVRLKVIAPPNHFAAPSPAAEPPDPPAPSIATAPSSGRYAVQAGAFADRGRAEAISASLAAQLGTTDAVRVAGPMGRPPLWRVLIGSRLSMDDATALADKIRRISGAALVVQDAEANNGTPEPVGPETIAPETGSKGIP
ncbi:MAG TPA: septal ring lytic transglycosylase RlpA family protein [Bryobacteraceae bacterium]|nr:septal ring lytic transglycosylase RlpA family protein [Bryobacteraceae bacterium]